MTDWSTAPPGPEMDVALAEKIMGWKRFDDPNHFYADRGEIGFWDGNWNKWIERVPDDTAPDWVVQPKLWQPSRGDLAAVFQVMEAFPRPRYYWDISEIYESLVVMIGITTEDHRWWSDDYIQTRVFWDEPGVDGDRARAFCLGVCRAALLAAEGESDG